MYGLVEFLRARLDEREAAAKAAGGRRWMWRERGPAGEIIAPLTGTLAIRIDASTNELRRHIALNDPAYVLADIAAKRLTVDLHASDGAHECPATGPTREAYTDYERNCLTLRLLAAPFATHPAYDSAWAVPMS